MRSNMLRLALLALAAILAAAALPPAAPGAEDGADAYRYTFRFENLAERLDPRHGWTADRASSSFDLQIRAADVVAVTFFLNWTDDEGANDTLRLSAREPGGTAHGPVGGAAARGSIALRVLGDERPDGPVVIDAKDEDEAYRKLAALHPPSRWATGVWNATLRVDAKGSTVGGVIPVADPGNDWDLTVTYRYRQALLVDVEPLGPGEAPPDDEPLPNGTGDDHPFNPDPEALTEVRYPTFWETPEAEAGVMLMSAGLGVAAALLVAGRMGRASPLRK
ncbi:MAG TPA: hypothetical protein VM889_00550 [Candidatus Thermoplasmatota archaeon]|nr:hypothetical protein [Candidatus Thermoplasmatota archaeon]